MGYVRKRKEEDDIAGFVAEGALGWPATHWSWRRQGFLCAFVVPIEGVCLVEAGHGKCGRRAWRRRKERTNRSRVRWGGERERAREKGEIGGALRCRASLLGKLAPEVMECCGVCQWCSSGWLSKTVRGWLQRGVEIGTMEEAPLPM